GAALRLHRDTGRVAARPRRIERDDEVALATADAVADGGAGGLDDITGAAEQAGERSLQGVLKVATLGGAPGPLLGASVASRLQANQAITHVLEGVVHLGAKAVQRAVLAAGIEQPADDGAVTVEVAGEQRAHAADGAVAALLIEQLVDEPAQRAAVAEEVLQHPRRARRPAG